MTPLRTKDRLFLAVAIPAAATAAYFWLWRTDAAKKADALETEKAALVAPESFESAKASATAELEAARAELEREKSAPRPAKLLETAPGASPADREGAVLAAFRDAGIAVLRAEDAQGGKAGGELAAAAGFEPRCRRYTLDGAYPAVRRALDLLASRRIAAIPEKIEMRGAGAARWIVTIWE